MKLFTALLALATIGCGTAAVAQFFPAAPAPLNLYTVYDYATPPGFSDATGRTKVTPNPTLISTDHVFLVAGQSHSASISSGASCGANQVSNTTKVLNFSIYDGNTYQLVNPMLGAGYGQLGGACNQFNQGWLGVLGDLLINNSVYTKVIFVPVAVGGSFVSDWSPLLGGVNVQRLIIAMRYLNTLGWLPKTDMIFAEGQAEVSNANPAYGCTSTPCTTTAQYIAAVRAMGSMLKQMGFTGKIYVNRGLCPFTNNTNCSNNDGLTYSNFSNIDAGQTGVVDNVTFFAGPSGHNNLCNNYGIAHSACVTDAFGTGALHYNDAGLAVVATAWCTLLKGSAC